MGVLTAQFQYFRHDHIFQSPDDLPTFSSPAIESNIHRIPGLSENFVYLNDDILLLQPVSKEMFYSDDTGQMVWLTYNIPYFDANLDAYALSMIFVDKLYDKVLGERNRWVRLRKNFG